MRTLHPFCSLPFLFICLLFQTQDILAIDNRSSTTTGTTVEQPNPAYPLNNTEFIRTCCGTTLYPELCYTSLAQFANNVRQDPGRLARTAISLSLSEAKLMPIYVSNLTHQAEYEAEPRAMSALRDCFNVFRDAVEQLQNSLKQLRRLQSAGPAFVFQVSNIQTWMSAALTNEDTCSDGFDGVPDGPLKTDVCDRVVRVKEMTSNALALVNHYVAREL